MKKSYYFIITLDIYPFDIMVSVEEKDKVLLERLKGLSVSTDEEFGDAEFLDEMTNARSIMFSSGQTVIRLKNRPKYEMIPIISHEAFHATTFIMERIGMELKNQVSDEAYAYLLAYIVKEICTKMKI